MAVPVDFDYKSIIKTIIERSMFDDNKINGLGLSKIFTQISQEIRVNILKILNKIFSDKFITKIIYLDDNGLTNSDLAELLNYIPYCCSLHLHGNNLTESPQLNNDKTKYIRNLYIHRNHIKILNYSEISPKSLIIVIDGKDKFSECCYPRDKIKISDRRESSYYPELICDLAISDGLVSMKRDELYSIIYNTKLQEIIDDVIGTEEKVEEKTVVKIEEKPEPAHVDLKKLINKNNGCFVLQELELGHLNFDDNKYTRISFYDENKNKQVFNGEKLELSKDKYIDFIRQAYNALFKKETLFYYMYDTKNVYMYDMLEYYPHKFLYAFYYDKLTIMTRNEHLKMIDIDAMNNVVNSIKTYYKL